MKRTKSIFLIFILSLALVVASSPIIKKAVAEDVIKIGMTCDLTGPVAVYGIQGSAGAKAYFNYINDTGGLNGKKLVLLAESDEFKPEKTLAAAKKLVERDKVFCFVSNIGTSCNAAIIPYFEKKKVLNVGPMAGASSTWGPKFDYTFVVFTSRELYGRIEVDYIVNELNMKNAKIVHIRTDEETGLTAARGVVKQVEFYNKKGYGIKVVSEIPYKYRTTDFTSHILKAMQAKPDILILTGYHPPVVRLAKEVERQGMKVQLVIDPAACDPKLYKHAGSAVEGAIVNAVNPDINSDEPGVVEHRRLMKKYFPKLKPTTNSLQGALGAKLFVVAAKKLGNKELTTENLKNMLESGEGFVTGIQPPLVFSKTNHLGVNKTLLYKVRNGKFVKAKDWVAPIE